MPCKTFKVQCHYCCNTNTNIGIDVYELYLTCLLGQHSILLIATMTKEPRQVKILKGSCQYCCNDNADVGIDVYEEPVTISPMTHTYIGACHYFYNYTD